MSHLNLSRRDFIKHSATASAGLVIGFYVPMGWGSKVWADSSKPDLEVPNAFIKITPGNAVTVVINKLEMGQGVFTSMAQLIAEELECNWKDIRSVAAPVAPVYNHTYFPMQMTGGSTALNSTWMQYRRVGAMARQMLISAAANEWNVQPQSCHAQDGFVIHTDSGKKLSYGDLAIKAATLPKPEQVQLKAHKDFKLIGRSVGRVDAYEKSSGQAIYGIDVRLPGMLYAVIARPPVFGATLKSVDDTKAKKIVGVVDVLRLKNKVAVLAQNTWVARKGREALKIEWSVADDDKISTAKIINDYKKQAQTPGLIAKNQGQLAPTFGYSADYQFPYLAHATMEPMNCTIRYDGQSCELWAGHQMPTGDRDAAARVLGISPDKVVVHTTYAGGSFGRRGNKNSDYVVEAAEVAGLIKKPVKVVWTREDDMKGGYYRPMYTHRVQVASNENGQPSSWKHVIVGQSVVADSPFEKIMIKNGVDPTVVGGVIDSPYEIENFQLQLHTTKLKVPTSWWRSVEHTHTGFVMETVIDELAHRAKTDPILFRKSLLKKSPRHLAVLNLLEKHWKKPSTKGHAIGLAVHESFNTVVGHIAEVSMHDGHVKVHKVISAVDCGTVVNPDGARMQVESAIAMGLSAMLYGHIEIKNGEVVQGNFNNYPVVRLNEMPKVEVHFVESTATPTGLGEPGLPPLAPAIANAMYKLTKKRVRSLPLQPVV